MPLAIINGRQLAELSMRSMGMDGEPVAMEDLLSCVKNIQQVAAVLQQPGRRYKGPGGTEEVCPGLSNGSWQGFPPRQQDGLF